MLDMLKLGIDAELLWPYGVINWLDDMINSGSLFL